MNAVAKKQRGNAAVEFAIIAPLLFLIFFGIINWGVLLFDKAIITNAAREGARWASINTTSSAYNGCTTNANADPCGVAYNYAVNNVITFSGTPNLTVTYPAGTPYTSGILQTVTVTYTFTGVGYAVSQIIGSAGSLTATSSMYHE